MNVPSVLNSNSAEHLMGAWRRDRGGVWMESEREHDEGAIYIPPSLVLGPQLGIWKPEWPIQNNDQQCGLH